MSALEIRHRRLYRESYQRFEDYHRERWGFSKTHANRLVDAAETAALMTPVGVTAVKRASAWVQLFSHTFDDDLAVVGQRRSRRDAPRLGPTLSGEANGYRNGDTDRETKGGREGPQVIRTAPEALQPPRTLLADGFSVAEGSWLIGDRFPAVQGWNAVLVVDHPLQVLQAYLEQAQAAGFADFAAFVQAPQGPCVAQTDRYEYTDVALAPHRAEGLWCDVGARRPSRPERFDVVFFELYVEPSHDCSRACGQSDASYLEIEVEDSRLAGH